MAGDTGTSGQSDARQMRICVLQSSYEESKGELVDLDPARTPEIYDAGGKYSWSHAFIKKSTAVQQVRDLVASKQHDVYLNLCDGAWDEDRAGQEVVDALERFGVAYTGADKVFYEPSKELMKRMAWYYEIPTPGWAFVHDVDMTDDTVGLSQVEGAVKGLKYPLIVKHHNGYSSVGMGRDCKVTDSTQLLAQVRKFVSAYGGALIEEFIAGREFTVLVMEGLPRQQQGCRAGRAGQQAGLPIALLPVECRFAPGEDFKHFDLKWKEYEGIGWVPLNPEAEPELDAKLRAAAISAFVALRGVSYGRCDFRVSHDGTVYFLEINPNCGLFYPRDAYGSADVILGLDPHVKHSEFIDHLVGVALARRAAKQLVTEVKYQHGVGYGLFVARDVAPGEVVVSYEGRPHVLVTRQHVQRTWGPDADPGPCPVEARRRRATTAAFTPPRPPPEAAGLPTRDDGPANAGDNGHSGLNSNASNGGGRGEAAGGDEGGPGPQQVSGAAVNRYLPDFEKLKGQWFRSYAYPVTDEVWVTWSDDPDDWLPLNHSCDPSTWLEGLNLVARRPLRKGEQVTADYSTFNVHNMHEFACKCGATRCRGTVKASDYLAPWLEEWYGEHISEHIANKRRILAELEAAQDGKKA